MFLRQEASENKLPPVRKDSWHVFTSSDAVLAHSETETPSLSCSKRNDSNDVFPAQKS